MSRARILADYVSSGDELALKAPLASPTFTGIATAPSLVLTPGSAPTATTGAVYYNSTSETVYVYNGHAWMPLTDSPTGGAVTSYNLGGTNYIAHIFTSSGTFITGAAKTVEYLVVAGGGGGGGYQGGGGGGGYRSSISGESTGGGGTLESALSLSATTTYTITVGLGGVSSSGQGGTGGDSSIAGSGITTITSSGGGGGGTGNAGGSGGGGDSNGEGAGTANQGYAGGAGAVHGGNQYYNGGGGGGAGSAGITSSVGYPNNGNGGKGVESSASGSPVYYAGGGGGGSWGRTSAGANVGLGAKRTQVDLSDDSSVPVDGILYGSSVPDAPANRGGGGSAQASSVPEMGKGGSGIVIIRYSI